jgi:hypothetical protein
MFGTDAPAIATCPSAISACVFTPPAAPKEYQDPATFFGNTHPTEGLRLLENVCRRHWVSNRKIALASRRRLRDLPKHLSEIAGEIGFPNQTILDIATGHAKVEEGSHRPGLGALGSVAGL